MESAPLLTLRVVTSGRLSDLCGLTFIGPVSMSSQDSTAAYRQSELDPVAFVDYVATDESETWPCISAPKSGIPRYRAHVVDSSDWKEQTHLLIA